MKSRFPLSECLIVFIIPFIFYLGTLNPALFRNDSPEVMVGCIGLGVIHAPGYPFYMLAGRLFSFLQLGNPAMTLNFFAAFLGAIAALLFFLNARLFLNHLSIPAPASLHPVLVDLLCLIAALNFGLSQTFWGNALAAKGGIYLMQIVLELSIILAAQTLVARNPKPRNGMFLLFAFLFAMGFCNHWPTQMLFAVLVALWVLFRKFSSFVSSCLCVKNLVYAVSLSLCALSLYLYLPIRAAAKPPIDFGAPSNFHRLMETITRMTYLKVETLATAPASYFTSLFHKMEFISDHILREFCPLFLFFAVGGVYFLYKRNKAMCLAAIGLMALVLFTNILYLQASPIEYWHIADHLLTNNWVIGFLGCVGMFWLLSLQYVFKKLSMWTALFAFACSLPWAYLNGIQANSQTRQFLYYGYGLTALKSLPQDSVYFSENDYDYFSALYLTETFQLRPDIHLILTPFLDKPYQFGNALSAQKPLFAGKEGEYGEGRVFRALGDPRFNHPVFCTFPNAYFSQLYLKFNSRLAFEPQGILTHVLRTGEKAAPKSDFPFLSDFYGRYLAPEISQPNEVNGLLREICAHPLLNAARFEKLHGSTAQWAWYHFAAIKLITEPEFHNEVLMEFKSNTIR